MLVVREFCKVTVPCSAGMDFTTVYRERHATAACISLGMSMDMSPDSKRLFAHFRKWTCIIDRVLLRGNLARSLLVCYRSLYTTFGSTTMASKTAASEPKPDAKPPPDPKERLEAAEELVKSDPPGGIAALRAIIASEGKDAELIRAKEGAIGLLTTALADAGDATGLRELLQTLKPLYANFAKAKTARIVRTVIDALATIPNTAELQVCISSCLSFRKRETLFLEGCHRQDDVPPSGPSCCRLKCAKSRSSGLDQRSVASCASALKCAWQP